MINLKLFEFALSQLSACKSRYIFQTVVLTALIFLSSSVFFVTGALKKEASYSIDSLPDITVSASSGGMKQFIRKETADRIIEIPGVSYAEPRVWGLYRFDYLNTNLTIVGVDIFSVHKASYIEKALNSADPQLLMLPDAMITGEKLKKTLTEIYNEPSFNFQKPDGEYVQMKIGAVFKPDSQIISSDAVIMQPETASEILGIPEDMATDIAVYIPNPEETATVASKIAETIPNAEIRTKDDTKASYQNVFDYKSGIFLLLFTTCLFTFFMIVFDRMITAEGGEKKLTAVLKALGYTVTDILKIRFYEAAAVSLISYALGILSALIYVFSFNAPLLRGVFMGYSYLRPDFVLPFHIGIYELVVIFFATVPVYIAAVTVPAWKNAVTEAGDSIR